VAQIMPSVIQWEHWCYRCHDRHTQETEAQDGSSIMTTVLHNKVVVVTPKMLQVRQPKRRYGTGGSGGGQCVHSVLSPWGQTTITWFLGHMARMFSSCAELPG